ncbi:MAG: type II toxin-antitoxin system VapC family toxin [Pseudomonadota bacterium]
MIYPDASVLVAASVNEPRTDDVLALLSGTETFATSGWTLVEVASALGIKQRTGQIGADDRVRALAGVRAVMASGFTTLSVDASDFSAATRFMEQSQLPLRGGDALHLAIASARGATIWTLDRRMADAGAALGIAIRLI